MMKYTMVKFSDGTYGVKDGRFKFYDKTLEGWTSQSLVYKYCRHSFEEAKEVLFNLELPFKEINPETGEEIEVGVKESIFTRILNYFNINNRN